MTDRKLPSGWWLVPCILGGACIWAAIITAIVRGLA